MIADVAASVVGGFFGARGQDKANEANREEARRNRLFQSEEARINRSFQERMRNTSWQAAVADMHAAGINPAIAYSQGGAAAPGGSMAGGSQAAPMQNVASSAIQGVMAGRELQVMNAQLKKTKAEARTAEATADVETARSRYLTQGRRGESGAEGPPLLREQVESSVRESIANAARAEGMSHMAGLGGQAAQGFQEFMPAFRRITRVAGEGANSLAGMVSILERAARMRDEAVRAWLGLPKSVVQRMLRQFRPGG